MRHVEGMGGRNLLSLGTTGGKSMRIIAAQNVWLLPESLCHNAHAKAGRLLQLERVVLIIGHTGHDQSAAWPQSCQQGAIKPNGPFSTGFT
jgi:hypothetical protein